MPDIPAFLLRNPAYSYALSRPPKELLAVVFATAPTTSSSNGQQQASGRADSVSPDLVDFCRNNNITSNVTTETDTVAWNQSVPADSSAIPAPLRQNLDARMVSPYKQPGGADGVSYFLLPFFYFSHLMSHILNLI
jgi:hypothetical protein